MKPDYFFLWNLVPAAQRSRFNILKQLATFHISGPDLDQEAAEAEKRKISII